MRAPDKAPPRSVDKIAQDIITKLDAGRTIAIERMVRRLIDNLRQIKDKPPEFGNQRENLEYLRELRKDIDRLMKTLRRFPNENVFMTLFAPYLEIQAPDCRASSVVQAINAKMEDATTQYAEGVLWFEALRDRCDLIAKVRPGKHPHYGQQQFRAALAARVAMAKVGKKATSGTWQSRFRQVATLFYEATTGEPEMDIERACDEVLHLPLSVRTENVQYILFSVPKFRGEP
jgi:hypothetical protein